jgi:hypothetical protein
MGEWYWGFEKSLPHCLVKVAYIHLTGDLASGVLLSQLAYWFRPTKTGLSRLKVVSADGRLVVAKRHEDWERECGLSARQARYALRKLEDLNLVRTTVERFNGAPTTHIWLDLEELKKQIGGTVEEGEWAEVNVQIVQNENDTLYKTTNMYTENTAETMNANEILKNFQAGTSPVNGSGLQAMTLLWKKRMSLYTKGFVKDLTGEEKGMLKHVHKTLGEQAVPLLDYVLSNWGDFMCEVEEVKGEKISSIPTCGSFCKHYEIGLHMIAAPKKEATGPSVVIVKPNNTGHTVEDKVTEEDIAATLEALNALKKK